MRSGPIIFSTKIELKKFPCTEAARCVSILQLFLEIIACYLDYWHRLVSQISFFCIDLTRLTVSPCRVCLFVFVFIIRNGQIRFLLNKSLNHHQGSRIHTWLHTRRRLCGCAAVLRNYGLLCWHRLVCHSSFFWIDLTHLTVFPCRMKVLALFLYPSLEMPKSGLFLLN